MLDVGCGEGYVTSYIKKNNKVKIKGIDLNKDMVVRAKKMDPSINFDVGSIYDLKFKSATFDTVLSNEVWNCSKHSVT